MQPPIVCPGHVRPLAEVSFSPETPDGVFLISACLDGAPMLRDGGTGDWIGTFAGHKGAVWSARLCREARLAATGSGDFSAKVWDAINGSCLGTLQHNHIVKSVDFSDDRSRLITGGHEGLIRLFDVETLNVVAQLDKSKPITKCSWVGQLVASGTNDGLVDIWDMRLPEKVATLHLTEQAPVMDLEIAMRNGIPTMVVASGEAVHFFDVNTWAPSRDPILAPVHFREEGGASLSPDGTKLILGGGRHGGSRQGALGVEKGATRVGDVGSDLTVFVLDVDTGNIIDERKGHCGPVRCLRYHPTGATVATGSEDGTIRLWDATLPNKIRVDD